MAVHTLSQDNDVENIDVGRDFSPYPAGRFRTDGKFSGEAFREKCLVPALKRGKTLRIELDSALAYGSSSLEEAFGGLVRVDKLRPEELKTKLQLLTKRKSVEREIWSYIQPED